VEQQEITKEVHIGRALQSNGKCQFMISRNELVRLIGFPATMIHGDPLMLDRWRWLAKRLPRTANKEKLIDVGCGTGAFSIGATLRGYHVLGLSWDERNQRVAQVRAGLCHAPNANFEVLDVRQLHQRVDLLRQFDIAICLETIEHVLDDKKLVSDIARCLKPGGRLLLTTPNYYYQAITPEDNGPFPEVETGWHVRKGYTPAMLTELIEESGLICQEITYCSGYVSQKVTYLYRHLSRLHWLLGWSLTLPLRLLPPVFDGMATPLLDWPGYSICIEAFKPRLSENVR
jgi:SAM-dependent methyltransferase